MRMIVYNRDAAPVKMLEAEQMGTLGKQPSPSIFFLPVGLMAQSRQAQETDLAKEPSVCIAHHKRMFQMFPIEATLDITVAW